MQDIWHMTLVKGLLNPQKGFDPWVENHRLSLLFFFLKLSYFFFVHFFFLSPHWSNVCDNDGQSIKQYCVRQPWPRLMNPTMCCYSLSRINQHYGNFKEPILGDYDLKTKCFELNKATKVNIIKQINFNYFNNRKCHSCHYNFHW